jgi:tripartite-type tricarboxylate transporter receptor subunit TctC
MWRSLYFCAALIFVAADPCLAEDVNYPTKLVRLISSFEAGGGNDAMARTLAQKFSEIWKKNTIVEDRPGGNGNIGTDYVARAPADGHTLLVTTNATIVINPQLFKSVVQYDPVNDFAPVSLLAKQPFVLVVHPSVPVQTFTELVDYARSHPGKLNFASSGSGGGAHLSGEMLKTFLHLQMTHVPYKGAAPALTAVVAGQVDFMFVAILTARPYLEGGQLRGLAVTSKTRNSSTPDLPAVAEFPGLEGFEADLWYGLLAPAKTDPAIVNQIYLTTRRALEDPVVRERFESFGTVLVGNSPDEFSKIIRNDIVKWSHVIQASGIDKQL